MATTRSQTRKAAAATSPVLPPQGDYVTVNWAFFDKSHPHDKPLPIDIPRQLFESNLLKCRYLFAKELLELVEFQADLNTIKFWQVCSSPRCTLHKLNTTLIA
jgi:hypothetical protein